ncbi:MAG: hypothetical protein ACKVT2_14885 [Saprospiraceae bacterium]
MSKRRFPGINPFQTEERDRFFGRDDDIRELHALITLEKVVVLFGKSGHGKSSLLNAGIVPRFLQERSGSERRYEPTVVKFGACVPGSTPPSEKARQFLENGLPESPQYLDIGPSLLDIGHSLWSSAKRSGQRRIVLIFDQFEEFFTYPLAQQQRFADEIGELLHTDMPPELAGRFAELSEDLQDLLAEKMDVKAVFAIREDRLHLLDKLKYPLPAIFGRRYPLLPLPREQAREAIEKPAGMTGDFESPVFTFSEAALDQILEFLQDGEHRVETNQLQILAESFEKRAETEHIARFTPENLGALKKIVADYYHEKINALPAEADRMAARRLCEEGLAQEGEPPVRLNLHEAQILNFYGIQPVLLEELVRSRLLRAEPGAGGGYTYELPHDTLLEPVLDARRERLAAENRLREKEAALAAERRAQEAEAQVLEEKRRAEEAERLKNEAVQGRKRARVLAVLAGLVAVLAVAIGLFARQQQQLAAQNETKALKSAQEATSALDRMKAAEAAREKTEFNQLRQDAHNFAKGGYCDVARQTLSVMDSIAMRHEDLREAWKAADIELKRACEGR